jgi:hypothetical protein
MSDPRRAKRERETGQVRAFLEGIGMPFQSLGDGPDPPDIYVFRQGLPRLDIEIREYHPTSDRVKLQSQSREFLEILNGLIEKHPNLNGVSLLLLLQNALMPKRSEYRAIAQELVLCIETILRRGWISDLESELLFLDYILPGAYEHEPRGTIDLSAKEWPLVDKHISQIDLSIRHVPFALQAKIYQTHVAWCSPSDDQFRAILKGKKERLEKAIQSGSYFRGESPLWLLIPTNTLNDLSSFVFNSARLKDAIDKCGFDFNTSPFDEVWLMDETGSGRSQRIHPWDTQTFGA